MEVCAQGKNVIRMKPHFRGKMYVSLPKQIPTQNVTN